jgi:hypothetical protein
MKIHNYLLIPLILSLLFISACAKKQALISSEYIWNPETESGRLLKILYFDELMGVFNRVSAYNFPVQKNGLGFTVAESCQQKKCTNEEMSKFWLFLASSIDFTVSNNKYGTIQKRATYVVKRRLPDFLFSLKDLNMDNLYKDTNFMGFMFSFTWKSLSYPEGLIKSANFENVHIYIPKLVFKNYLKKDITFAKLLNKSRSYIRINKPEAEELFF